MPETAAEVDPDRLDRLRAMRDRLVDMAGASYAAHDKSVLAAAGGGLAVSTTAVGMLLARDVPVSTEPLACALAGFAVAMLAVIQSHKLSATAAERACTQLDLEISGRIRAANTAQFNGPVHAANALSTIALGVGVVGLVWLILAAAQPPDAKPDDGVRGTPVPKVDPRPAPPKPPPVTVPKPQ